ncbi:winged helix-turn-helix transcriptional regulator [Natronosalvus vescus]|uniref:winged helix-turn-helix transcriptional regulator n=1 Tax=Natronosalvus vescus TaxID=2953881 RepID=UPI002091363A|nr:helix-turn-helix domain-containing protein [Natronosalvus vescus]
MSSDQSLETDQRAGTVTTDQDAGSLCPVVRSIEQIGSQWRLAVLHELQKDEHRFNELKRATGANARTLSRVLEDLGDLGFVDRRIEEDAPIATYYSLTPKGRSLEPVFDEIECWAGSWLEESSDDE